MKFKKGDIVIVVKKIDRTGTGVYELAPLWCGRHDSMMGKTFTITSTSSRGNYRWDSATYFHPDSLELYDETSI